MATRQQRLNEFSSEDERPAGQLYELLCEDHVGTYVLPFLCRWTGETWRGGADDTPIDVSVIGWRRPRSQGPRAKGRGDN